MAAPVRFTCHGCGATVDAAAATPFRCPAAVPGDDVDHLLVPEDAPAPFGEGTSEDPYLRYRALLSPYRLLRAAGLPDQAWLDLAGELEQALRSIEGHGFRVTPLALQPALARAAGHDGALWVKDETGAVSGSASPGGSRLRHVSSCQSIHV